MRYTFLNKALDFATRAYFGREFNSTKEPYINHAVKVSHLVSEVTDDDDMIAAALLHNAMDSKNCSQIKRDFGLNVYLYINAINDECIANQSPGTKTIKLALILNEIELRVRNGRSRMNEFVRECRYVMNVLQEGDADLYERVNRRIGEYCKQNLCCK